MNFKTLDQPGIKVAAVDNTTTMRGAKAHLKNTKFMMEAVTDGTLRKAYDNNGLKDSPIRTQ